MKISIQILDLRTNKVFTKEFKTEFERDKYIRRSKHFKDLKVLTRVDEGLLR